jgi:hypothetical protein
MSLGGIGGRNAPGAAQLDFLQSVNNLVKIKHEMCTIGNKHAISAVQTFICKLC